MHSKTFTRAGILALIVLAAACAKDSPFSPGSHLPFGEWGGDKADVTASSTSTNVLLGCSTGSFAGNIALDSDGRFAVNGTWNGSTGPIQLNGQMPAQLSGQVIGKTLTFAIAVNDTITKHISSLGPATVVLGRQSTGEVCPL